jgi:Tfp pilus assembly protein PilF
MELDLLSNTSFDALFAATYPSQQQLDELSKQALSNGIDLYTNGDHKGAINEFKRSIGLSPYSEYTADASNYMAEAYIQLGENEKAIDTYKKAMSLNPYRDDTHIKLGNLYFSLDRYNEAANEYKQAVRLNPSTNNYFSLGQSCLYLDRLNEAETIFAKVRSMEPDKPNGDYGLGLTYSRQGRYDKAIEHFKKAVSLDAEFYDGYAEMAYAHIDMGQKDEAEEIKDFLRDKDPALAYTVSEYIYQVSPPVFSGAYFTEAFGFFPTKTPVSTLDTYLENANASKKYTLKISFDKEMDRAAVENLANWNISRSSGSGPGEAYNFGLPVPSTEVDLPTLPLNVYYDADNWTATVMFQITQNATADGTIDPTHIEFKFSGKDIYGNKIDTDGDQYSGFSGIA